MRVIVSTVPEKSSVSMSLILYAVILNGWGWGIRTPEWRSQSPLPYRLANPQKIRETKEKRGHSMKTWTFVKKRNSHKKDFPFVKKEYTLFLWNLFFLQMAVDTHGFLSLFDSPINPSSKWDAHSLKEQVSDRLFWSTQKGSHSYWDFGTRPDAVAPKKK